MQMKDVSEEELKQAERNILSSKDLNEVSDRQLINMVQKIKEGKVSEVVRQRESNMIEPEVPKVINNITEEVISYSNANYWKIIGLPSKSRFYPAGVEILGRPMKVLEVKKISSMNDENGDFIINDIVRKTTKGLPLEEMYVADKLFIAFWLRANTYRESGYVVPFICNKCQKKSEFHFEVNNFEVQEISDDFDPKKDFKIGDNRITYDYLRVRDELYIDRFKELNRNTIGEIDPELLSMAQMIKTIDGKEQSLLQKYYWITELHPGSYSYMKTLFEKKGMGIKPFINITCKECGGTATTAVSFRQEFFVPEFKFE